MDSQDPRLEAAKPKGRGTADASEKALEVGMGRWLEYDGRSQKNKISPQYDWEFKPNNMYV